jgi:hypothetical protein
MARYVPLSPPNPLENRILTVLQSRSHLASLRLAAARVNSVNAERMRGYSRCSIALERAMIVGGCLRRSGREGVVAVVLGVSWCLFCDVWCKIDTCR